MKITFLFLTIFILCANINAQVSGYQGKKLILKTDLVDVALNEGYALSLEAAIGRYLGATVEFAKRVQQFENLNPASDFDEKDEEKATVSTSHVGLGLRFYRNRAFTAPRGAYFFSNLSLGVSDIDIEYNRIENGRVESIRKERAEEIIFSNIELGLGKQSVLANRIILDIGLGINFSDFLVVDGSLNYNYFEPLTTRQGQNLLGFKIFGENYVALSGHFSVGILLF